HGSLPLRVLRSFPTRRSSDLLVHLDHGERETVGERRGLDGREPERGGRRQYGWLGAIDGLGGQADGRTGGQYRRCHREHQDRVSDRKSIRLNSSHVAISYAVF